LIKEEDIDFPVENERMASNEVSPPIHLGNLKGSMMALNGTKESVDRETGIT
jgi:hypothetical protein